MSEGGGLKGIGGDTGPDRDRWFDEPVESVMAASHGGDRKGASGLAEQVLGIDRDFEDELPAPGGVGQIRRLTILFADLVDSTLLSTRVEPETLRAVLGRYRDLVLRVVDRFEGHVGSAKGDGLLAVFGHPKAHEDDVRRAVLAGLEISREVARLAEQAKRRFGVDIAVQVGVHRGLVYLDIAQDDVYGLAANLSKRVSGLAPPGAVVVSDAVAALIGEAFELQARPPVGVKGVDEPIAFHIVLGERADAARLGVGSAPLVGRDRELAWLQRCWAAAAGGHVDRPGGGVSR